MSQDTVLGLEEALALIDDDWDGFQAMATLFVDQGPKDLAEIKNGPGRGGCRAPRDYDRG